MQASLFSTVPTFPIHEPGLAASAAGCEGVCIDFIQILWFQNLYLVTIRIFGIF